MREGSIRVNFFWKLNQELKRGKSPIVLVTGEPRTGKTELAIGWSWLIKDNFDIKRDIFTSVDKLLEDVEKKDIWNRSLILDEAQKDLDIGAWNSKLGRALVKYNGSQAIRGNILWIIMPYARWLPWVQQPAINFKIEVYGYGWADYWHVKTKASDYAGKTYHNFLESFKMPRIPTELVKIKEAWEIPEKKDILRRINIEKSVQKKPRSKPLNVQRMEMLAELSKKYT